MGSRRGHGEGSIYQRGDGRWVASVNIGWQDGKRKRKVIYGKTRKEASDKLRAALRQAEQGNLRTDERRKVAQYLEWWLEECILHGRGNVRPSTAQSYEEKIRLHISPVIGHVRLTQLAPEHVKALMNQKLEEGLSPRTVEYIHAVLRRALGQAVKWGDLPRNVASLVDPPRVTRPEVKPLTLDEAQRILRTAEGHRLHALYVVAISLGVREGEVLGLRWADVNLDAGEVTIRQALQWLGGKPQFVEPKSRSSKRTLPLPRSTTDALSAHRQRQLKERMKLGPSWPDTDLVFTSEAGTPINPRNLLRHFYGLCAKAGIGRRRFHDIRHSTASFLLAQNVHPRVVMETLGHSQIGLTMNTYSHVVPSLQRDAADKMEGVLGKSV